MPLLIVTKGQLTAYDVVNDRVPKSLKTIRATRSCTECRSARQRKKVYLLTIFRYNVFATGRKVIRVQNASFWLRPHCFLDRPLVKANQGFCDFVQVSSDCYGI